MSELPEPDITRLSPEEIKSRMDRGEPVFLCDVRRHPDDVKAKGAIYFDPEALLRADRIQLPGVTDKNELIATY